VNRSVRVARVMDQDAPFLQFVNRCGLTPGVNLRIEHRDPNAESVIVKPEGRACVTLGTAAALKILVE
jgi:hypothetical protein